MARQSRAMFSSTVFSFFAPFPLASTMFHQLPDPEHPSALVPSPQRPLCQTASGRHPPCAMSSRPPLPPSHRNQRRFPSACCLLLLTLALLFASTAAKSSRRPITDNEIRQKKEACYTDVENGLWGWVCRSSPTEKENCVLRCLSPECYQLIYGGDPLEEGELDYVRGQEYKYCMHKSSLGESLDGVKGSFSYS